MEVSRFTLLVVAFLNIEMLRLFVGAKLTYEHYRLPTSVRPDSYKLKVITHLDDASNFTFEGEVLIKLQILEGTNNITLHARNLNINESKIKIKRLEMSKDTVDAHKPNCIKATATNIRHDYLIMQLCNMAKKGEEYSLIIPFKGVLDEHIKGYFRSSYKDRVKHKTRWLAATLFEATAARMAFPCFDEPALKATFTIILGHHKRYTALSNMPLKYQSPMSSKKDWVWSEFEESTIMSTYLVAYTLLDFAHVTTETTSKNNVLFRTWARPDVIDQVNYANVIGPKVLKFYEDTFDLKFSLPKIDQIVLPNFKDLGMENWGLITYQEKVLTYAENVTTYDQKVEGVTTVAHELAHQWFGNLVTMKWWNDIWLNEGFASYISTWGVKHLYPDWDDFKMDLVPNMLQFYFSDAEKENAPLSHEVTNQSQISLISYSFNTYTKASLMLRMMHLFLGNEAFLGGVKIYLKKHAYQSVDHDDLWNAFDEAARSSTALPESYNMKTIMDSWTLQAGYPIITVTRDYEKGTAIITQSRYLLDRHSNYRDTYQNAEKTCWWVPLSYTTRSELNFNRTTPRAWLECDANDVAVIGKITNIPANDWVLFNLKMSGLYKVKYDERNWHMLIETLTSDDYKSIDVINRAQLINDALNLAWSQDYNYDLALRVIKYLKRETEYVPWKSALNSLSLLGDMLYNTPNIKYFKAFLVKILTPIYLHLNGLNLTNPIDATDESKMQFKALIADWACDYEIQDCIQRSLDYFNEWRNEKDPYTNNPIPVEFRSVVYCNSIRYDEGINWSFLGAHDSFNIQYECGLGILMYRRSLNNNLHDLIRKIKDANLPLNVSARTEVDAHSLKNNFVNNLQSLKEYYSSDDQGFVRLLKSIARRISNRSDYENLKEFLENNENQFPKVKLEASQLLKTAKRQYRWKDQNYNEFVRSLKSSLLSDDNTL